EELTRGIDVTLGGKGLAKVLLIEPVRPPPAPIVVHTSASRASCADRRKFRFRLHHARHARVVEVYAYVNGRRRLHRRGRDLRSVTLKRLPQMRFTVRLEVFQSTG